MTTFTRSGVVFSVGHRRPGNEVYEGPFSWAMEVSVRPPAKDPTRFQRAADAAGVALRSFEPEVTVEKERPLGRWFGLGPKQIKVSRAVFGVSIKPHGTTKLPNPKTHEAQVGHLETAASIAEALFTKSMTEGLLRQSSPGNEAFVIEERHLPADRRAFLFSESMPV